MRMVLKVMSQVVSISGSSDDSDFKCFETSENLIAVERTRVGSNATCSKEHFVMECLVFKYQSSHDQVGVATDILCQAVVGNISSKEKG